MLYVAWSGLVLIWNFFEETYFCHLHIYLLACFYEIHLKFLLSLIYFHLDNSELWKQHQSVNEEMMGTDTRFRNSWAAWNPNQGMCNVLWQKFVIEVCGEKKEVFLQSFSISKCIGQWWKIYLVCYFNVRVVTSLLVLELSCFRKIVLPYHLRMSLCVFMRR